MNGGRADIPWEQLAEQLRPFIARRLESDADADDVLQEVMLRMHRGLPDLADDDRLTAWMYRIARNAIVDHHRRQARALQEDPAESVAVPAAGEDEPEDAATELARYIGIFVALLPPLYREAITLTELEGRSQKEAAEMLGLSPSTMKSRVQRGRAKLLKMLNQCCEIAVDARQRVIDFEPRVDRGSGDDCC